MPFSVVRGARDRSYTAWGRSSILVRIDGKVRPASAIHPDASAVEPPGIALIARRTAALLQQAHSAPRIRRTIVTMAVVGRARKGLGRASRTENDQRGSNQTQLNPILRIHHSQPPENWGKQI